MRIQFYVLLIAVICSGCGRELSDDQRSRMLVRGNGGDATTLDPALAEDIHSFNILIDMYEGLVAENATGEIIPGVAESWRVSDDGLLYSFQLRDDARWSNGDRVLAADFVRAFRHVANPGTASSYAFLFDAIAGSGAPDTIAVRAVSDVELEIRLAVATHHFLSLLALPTAFPRHESGVHLISNGAYRLEGEQTIGIVDLVKNPFYWDNASVWFERVRFLPVVDEMAEFNMYRAGEIDLTHNIPDEMVRSAIETNATEVRIAPSLAFYYYAFDLTEAPFDNKSLRQSLSMSIDRQVITDLLGRGDAPAYGIVPPGVADYSGAAYDWSTQPTPARVALAKRLYEEAGYSDDHPLQITLLYDAGGIHEKIALAVSSMWEKNLGVETVLENREWQYFLDSRDQRDDWDVMRFAWFGDYNAPSTFLEIFASDSVQNLSKYSSTAYDVQLLAASKSPDFETASEIMRVAEETLLGDYPVMPIYFFVSKHMVDRTVAGFETNVVDRHPSRFLRRETLTE